MLMRNQYFNSPEQIANVQKRNDTYDVSVQSNKVYGVFVDQVPQCVS